MSERKGNRNRYDDNRNSNGSNSNYYSRRGEHWKYNNGGNNSNNNNNRNRDSSERYENQWHGVEIGNASVSNNNSFNSNNSGTNNNNNNGCWPEYNRSMNRNQEIRKSWSIIQEETFVEPMLKKLDRIISLQDENNCMVNDIRTKVNETVIINQLDNYISPIFKNIYEVMSDMKDIKQTLNSINDHQQDMNWKKSNHSRCLDVNDKQKQQQERQEHEEEEEKEELQQLYQSGEDKREHSNNENVNAANILDECDDSNSNEFSDDDDEDDDDDNKSDHLCVVINDLERIDANEFGRFRDLSINEPGGDQRLIAADLEEENENEYNDNRDEEIEEQVVANIVADQGNNVQNEINNRSDNSDMVMSRQTFTSCSICDSCSTCDNSDVKDEDPEEMKEIKFENQTKSISESQLSVSDIESLSLSNTDCNEN